MQSCLGRQPWRRPSILAEADAHAHNTISLTEEFDWVHTDYSSMPQSDELGNPKISLVVERMLFDLGGSAHRRH